MRALRTCGASGTLTMYVKWKRLGQRRYESTRENEIDSIVFTFDCTCTHTSGSRQPAACGPVTVERACTHIRGRFVNADLNRRQRRRGPGLLVRDGARLGCGTAVLGFRRVRRRSGWRRGPSRLLCDGELGEQLVHKTADRARVGSAEWMAAALRKPVAGRCGTHLFWRGRLLLSCAECVVMKNSFVARVMPT
jgi:hypothetical protein